MTDQELLTYAAKAAGYDFYAWGNGLFAVAYKNKKYSRWNPLENDSDAFQLMVKLGLDIGFGVSDKGDIVCALIYSNPTYLIDCDNDALAATRRAITRAAAEIGKGM